ncbi:unnamed protein product [Oikopleura dioica]|uniref:Uncharacterized protein n=1 Tax=Oikopleura dioica TaxID=34765 RepID=E4XZ56_OIKDI|nr:unnamed protein product [Oikopleura dioica]
MIGLSPLDRLKKLTMRKDVNDGFSKILGIYRPRPTITERPNTKDKWFRDPTTLQWVSVEQVDALAISAA